MAERQLELLVIGAGPSNLGLAVALEEMDGDLARQSLVLEREEAIGWQRGTLMPWAQSQVSFLKDLVMLRNPRSRFTFLNYLHSVGRLMEFVNLATFTPYRVEISNYLRWVAESLENVKVEYGRACQSIEPLRDAAGTLTGWRVRLEDGSTIHCRILVVGVGRDAWIPPVFRALPSDRIIHSTQYLQRIAGFAARPAGAEPPRVVLIGGAQGSAEMLTAVLDDLPGCQATLVMRSVGLVHYQTSKFTNELYYPSFVDEFYHAQAGAQEQMLREMHLTNYSGLTPDLLDGLYRRIYVERLIGEPRIRMRTMTDVTAARMEGAEVVLTLHDRKTGTAWDLACDLILLGTGYDRQMPRLLRELADALGLRRIEVTRNYRLLIPGRAEAACYLQGVNEATHGIADSLLSVVAARSGEIVLDMIAARATRADMQPVLASLAET
jgi:L-ornithine N5-monooxygenase